MPHEFTNRPYSELSAFFIEQGCVPIGLLRGKVGPLPFSCAKLPNSKTVVGIEDSLYVLADKEWARANLGSFFDKEAGQNSSTATSIVSMLSGSSSLVDDDAGNALL